ncbi:type II secretion system F family protein [bacterium]|nr:type II secretion system F family protein [bacterium]
MFQQTLEDLIDAFRPERALVLYAQEGRELSVRAAFGVDPKTVWTTAPLSLSLFRRVFETGQPLLCADVGQSEEFSELTSLTLSGMRSLMCVPVYQHEHVKGLLHVDVRRRQVGFSPSQLAVMQSLARELEQRLRHLPAANLETDEKNLAGQPLLLAFKPASRVTFWRCLATLVGAGVSLTCSLELLSRSGEDANSRQVCARLTRLVETGHALSEAMRQCSPAFSAVHCQLVLVGERSGKLVAVLTDLAASEERTAAVQARLRSTLTYPLLLFVSSVLMLLSIPFLLLRGQLELLRSLNAKPSWLLQAAASTAEALSHPLPALTALLLLLGAVQALRQLGRQRRQWWDWGLRLPKLGKTLRLLTSLRFARSLSLQLQVGLSPLEALTSSARVSGNPLFFEEMWEARERLEAGEELSASLQASTNQLPPGFAATLRAGEESGRVPQLLNWLAEAYEMELELTLQSLCAALEPILLMLLGCLAAGLCLTTMMPMIRAVESL